MEKRYYWLKLADDFFTSKRIKMLRSLAGGDTFTIIYLKMQLKALKTEGYLYYDGIMDNFAKELALDIDETEENVKITIQYLLSVGLLISSEDGKEYILPYTQKLIGSEGSSTQRMRMHRDRKKQETLSQCDNNVTPLLQNGYGEIEIDKEKEIDIEKEVRCKTPYQQIADLYNDTCVSFPRLKTLSDARKKAIKARLSTYTVEDFKETFRKVEASDFLKGKNNRDWSATFDWIIKDSNMAKILDGNYDNAGGKDDRVQKTEWNPKTHNFFE